MSIIPTEGLNTGSIVTLLFYPSPEGYFFGKDVYGNTKENRCSARNDG